MHSRKITDKYLISTDSHDAAGRMAKLCCLRYWEWIYVPMGEEPCKKKQRIYIINNFKVRTGHQLIGEFSQEEKRQLIEGIPE